MEVLAEIGQQAAGLGLGVLDEDALLVLGQVLHEPALHTQPDGPGDVEQTGLHPENKDKDRREGKGRRCKLGASPYRRRINTEG